MSITHEYIKQTSSSKEVYSRATKVLVTGNTRNAIFFRPYPSYAKRARGSHIWDVDGNERIDFCFNFSVLILGHNHPKVVDAAKRQLERGTVFGAPTEEEVKLAEELVRRLPSAEMVRFMPSGTEAGMHALRLARAYTGKDKIIKFEGEFHGTYDCVFISVNPQKEKSGSSLNPNSVPEVEGLPEDFVKKTIILPYNNLQALEDTVRAHKGDLAAVIVEPATCFSGYNPPNKGFLKGLREITRSYDVLLIFDEVVTFRLAPGGGQELFGVVPDITQLGKAIGGGFPIGAVAASEEIMELYSIPEVGKPRLTQSGTFNAFPIAMATGLATLNELKPPVYESLNRRGQTLRNGLAEMLNDLNIDFQVTGTGSLFDIMFTSEKLVDYRSLANVRKEDRRRFELDLMNRGVYLPPGGHWCNISTATSNNDIKLALEAMEKSLKSLTDS